MVDQFLQELTSQGVDPAMRLACRWVDARFTEGRFDLVGQMLGQVPITLNPCLLVGLLSFTYCAKRQLGDSRVQYAVRIRPTLDLQFGQDRVEQIYSRLGPTV